jgi:hypothetical protein
MGPELSTYRLALVYLAERFAPDFRGLISANMFCSKLHLAALGLGQQASGMMDYVESAHPPFAKQFNIRGREQLQSQAVGVNIWSLLTVTSLIGSRDIHPDISNCFSNSLVEAILSHAPPASTPGNICPTPRFDHSGTANRLFVRDSPDRPKHFLRPNEPSFVLNGVLPIAKAIGRFAPEDMLHASQLSGVNLHCDIMDIPANAFTVSPALSFGGACPRVTRMRRRQTPYALEPNVSYTFHVPHPDEGLYGIVRVESVAEQVTVEVYQNNESLDAYNLEFDAWEEFLREKGMVITPLITRGGAGVVLTEKDPETDEETKRVGCLVPPAENEGLLLDASDCTYHALLDSDMTTAKLFFADVLREFLLPIGEILYLNMQVLEEERFRSQGRGGKVLYTRLNIPHVRVPEIGKLYVTCLHQPKTSHGRSSRSATAITLAVNPWDVQLASAYTGLPTSVVKHLR